MMFRSRRRIHEDRRSPSLPQPDAAVFRRSRTITGSQSQSVASAGESRAHLRSPRLHVHELRHHRRHIGGLLMLTLLAAGSVVWLLDRYIIVSAVVVQGAATETNTVAQDYNVRINRYFDSHPLERFDVVLARDRLLADLQGERPETASVSISNDSGLVAHRIVVQLRQPIARWQLGDTTYFVDTQGVLFQSVYGGASSLITVKDESGLPVATQRVASQSLMNFIGQTVGEIGKRGMNNTIKEVVLPRGTLREVDLMLTDRSYRIKLSLDRDIVQQVSDMINALRYIDEKNIVVRDYLDIRVEGRAFFPE